MPVQSKRTSPALPDTFDVTVGDLIRPKAASPWGRLIAYASKKWVANDPDRMENVRCAEVYLKNVEASDGSVRGHVEVILRFDLPSNVPREKRP
jgi:hypothetical protein